MHPVTKQCSQLKIHPAGLASSGRHNHQVSLARALDAQVAVQLAELEELPVTHLDHRREAQNQGWNLGEGERFAHGLSPFCFKLSVWNDNLALVSRFLTAPISPMNGIIHALLCNINLKGVMVAADYVVLSALRPLQF